MDLRGDDVVWNDAVWWDLEGVSCSLVNLDATGKTRLEGVDLEKRLEDLGVDEDFEVVLSGGIGGRSVFCICEKII